ncbi:unnamed protein product, partial [Adineta ricciae]
MTHSNALLPILETNLALKLYRNLFINAYVVSYGNCSCAVTPTCSAPYPILNGLSSIVLYIVPGMYVGCYPVESLLQSDLRCWYNHSCITEVQSYFTAAPPMNVTELNPNVSTEFMVNSTLEEILDKLMVEQWYPSIIYESYYNECAPLKCTHTYETRNSIIYIITTIIGLIGGLMTVLKLIVPRVVGIVRRRLQTRTSEANNNRRNWMKMKPNEIQLFLKNFNIFSSIPPTEDQYELRNQRISTRLFIVLLALSLTILILYTSLINITQTVNVDSPTMAQYIQLYSTYPQTLSCDCRQISINYDTFVHLNYSLHQICSSVFATKDWINYMLRARGISFYGIYFPYNGENAFQAMGAFCDLSHHTIENRLTQFYSTQLISSSVIPPQLFELQVESLISQFISLAINNFLLSLSSTRQITQGNSLLSGLQTNFVYTVYKNRYFNSYPVSYGNCSCATTGKCVSEIPIYDFGNGTRTFVIPGMYVGCYVVESLLQSDLRCFYNQTCISEVLSSLNGSTLMNVTAMDPNVSVEFMVNSTLEDILDKLMVEQWFPSITYESYYSECAPSKCTYTHETKNSIVYIVTMIIGLIGGLIT